MLGLGPKETSASVMIFVPTASTGAGFRAFCHEDVDGLLAVLRLREHVAERDVGQAIAVVVDVEAVDGVGMERVGGRICIEDDHGPRRIRGRLERVEVAEVESLVPERRTETESGEMIRHCSFLSESESGEPSFGRMVTNRGFDVAGFTTISELGSEARALPGFIRALDHAPLRMRSKSNGVGSYLSK